MSRNPLQSLVSRVAGKCQLLRVLPLALVLVAALAAPAGAFQFERVQGHMSFGYGRLMVSHSPAGSIGITVGFDHPASPLLDVGLDLGLYLYGNRTIVRGSLNATLDYSSFDLIAFTHWHVPVGPVTRLSVGPGLTFARADLSAAAGGGAFLDLPVNEVAPTLAVDLTMVKRKPAPVRVALVAGYRAALLHGEDWNQFSVRLGFHY